MRNNNKSIKWFENIVINKMNKNYYPREIYKIKVILFKTFKNRSLQIMLKLIPWRR